MEEGIARTNRLNIGAMRASVMVPPAAGAAAGRLVADSIRDDLASRLSGMLEDVVYASSDEVWLIRHLEFEADVNSDWGRDRLADNIARSFARSLAVLIRHPAEFGVVRFETRTRFLAQLLQDMAGGTAWSRWYYHSFTGLQSLPTSAAIRTVLMEEQGRCRDILVGYESAALYRVLNAMEDEDLLLVADALASHPRSNDEDAAAQVASIMSDAAVRLDPERAGVLLLQLCVARMRTTGKVLDAGFVTMASGASRLAELLNASPRQFSEIRKALMGRRLPSTYGRLDLEPLLRADGRVGRVLLAALNTRFSDLTELKWDRHGRQTNSPLPSDLAETGNVSTPFGGAFLLLPILAGLPVSDRPGRGFEDDPVENDAILRFLILIASLGRERRSAMLRDNVLWKITGNAAPVNVEDAALRIERLATTSASDEDWRLWSEAAVEALGPKLGDHADEERFSGADELLTDAISRSLQRVADAILRTFASSLSGFERSSLVYVRANFLDLDAVVTDDENRLIVRLSMPTLGYVLSRSGCMNQTFACSWLPGRRVELYRE